EVRRPEQDKADNDAHAEPEEPALAYIRLALEQRAKQIARCHHADPGDERLEHEHALIWRAEREAALMQETPEPSEVAELLGPDPVEQILPGDRGQRDGGDRPARQMDQT